jgi:DNA-binding SARP family transcriptional activator
VEYRILGPLEVVDEGSTVRLGTLKERAVLAVLLLHANEVVSRERLIDDLWGAAPPPTARNAISVYVSKLRKALAHDDPISPVGGGYRLSVEPERFDAALAQNLVARAADRRAAGDVEGAAQLLREALSLWRGPTLAGVTLEAQGRADVARLDELRLAAVMDRIDCDLARGHHERVLGELQVLVREHPLQERLRAQQMLALYRSERQADALEAYWRARKALLDDLGIEPGESLQRLQHAILRHDPSLERAGGTPAAEVAASAPPPSPARLRLQRTGAARRSRRRRSTALAVLAVLVAGGLGAAALSGSRAKSPRVFANSLVRLDPHTGAVISVARVPSEPNRIAVTPTAIWTANGDATISRYDLRTHEVQTRGGLAHQLTDITDDVAADGRGNVWVTNELPFVTRLAAGRGAAREPPLDRWKAQTIHVPGPAAGEEVLGGGYLWTIVGPYTFHGIDDRVSVIDPVTSRVVDSVRLGHATTALAFGDGAAWIGTFINEPTSETAPSILTGPSWLYVIRAGDEGAQPFLDRHPLRLLLEPGDTEGPAAIAVGEGAVWVLTCGTCNEGSDDETLVKIDPATRRRLDTIPLSGHPGSLAAGAGSVWLGAQRSASVWQLDPRTDRIVRTIHLLRRGAVTCEIAATRSDVWVAVGDRGGC